MPPRETPLFQNKTTFKKKGGLPWWSSGWDSTLPLQGERVQPLAGELRSHKPYNVAKNKQTKIKKKKDTARTAVCHIPLDDRGTWESWPGPPKLLVILSSHLLYQPPQPGSLRLAKGRNLITDNLKERKFRIQTTWAHTLALPNTTSMTWGKLLKYSLPHISPAK